MPEKGVFAGLMTKPAHRGSVEPVCVFVVRLVGGFWVFRAGRKAETALGDVNGLKRSVRPISRT